jgi:hypothetical protein
LESVKEQLRRYADAPNLDGNKPVKLTMGLDREKLMNLARANGIENPITEETPAEDNSVERQLKELRDKAAAATSEKDRSQYITEMFVLKQMHGIN